MPSGVSSQPRWRIARGARAAERAVLAEVDALLAAGGVAELARPVRLIVPSNALRLHLGTELVRRRGRSLLGVQVQTLYGAALEVLERAGERPPRGRLLLDVLARRLAGEEPTLAEALEPLVDGYGAVAATVRDLLDAGLTPGHAEAADEALAADGPAVASRAEVGRARALVRIAADLARGAEALGVGWAPALYSRAAELAAADLDAALPARAVVVHGFADATGVVLDLLAALLRHPRALLVLDHPPDPAADGEPVPAFTERLRRRLAPAFAGEPKPAGDDGATPPPALTAFSATTAEAEARELALRVRRRIDAGARPEAIGVVIRDLDLYRLPLRRHFGRLGVPFSGGRGGGSRGSLTPPGRRARALVELLRRGADLPADRWLDASERLGGRSLSARDRVDLRLAFFALGAGRLRDVARLDVDRYLRNGAYPLPVRQGLRAVSDEQEEEAPDADDARDDRRDEGREAVALRRRVPGERLHAAVDAAASLVKRLEGWPDEAPAAEHFGHLERLAREALGWRRGAREGMPAPAGAPVLRALDDAAAEVPLRLVLRFDEVRLLLGRALERVGWSELGGAGGGVRVLGVVEARGLTFEHLFLAGMSRGVFPRTVRPDPLLPDPLRHVLARTIPEVPIRQRGFDEERYLFAQLVSAAPVVTLSWPAEGSDRRPVPPSPLVERLSAHAGDRLTPERAPATWAAAGARGRDGEAARRPAREHATLAALHGPREAFAAALPAAVTEVRRALADTDGNRRATQPALEPAELAAARLAVLAEVDPDLSTTEGRGVRRRLGPYFGFVGALGGGDDPRRKELYVTALERMTTCPWQVFLEKLLRLEPTPDPVQALPDVDPLLLGNAVHKVLERLVLDALGGNPPATLDEAAHRPAVAAAWPPGDELKELLHRETSELVVEEGVALAGMARALAVRALPYLLEAAGSDWRAGSLPAAGAEVAGGLEVPDGEGRPRRLAFKADRADVRRQGSGQALVLTDYKTGRPLSTAKTETYRRRHLLAEIAAGRKLQAVAYALAEDAAAGRYLFLKPDLADDAREFAVTAGDREAADAFRAAVGAALAAWDAGAFFPRVVLPDDDREPPTCRWCRVAEACVRGDSGARGRLYEWAGGGEADGDRAGGGAAAARSAEEQALLGVWDLARKPDRQGKKR